MELIFSFFSPWIALIVLFILLYKAKNLRKTKRSSAEQEIKNERASAFDRIQETKLSSCDAVKSTEATAKDQIELAQCNGTEQIDQVSARLQADSAEVRQKPEQGNQTERVNPINK